ncbi:MAG: hypothetical protein V7L00_22370 [Nostoc sp.]|jgi:hypothetical protein|uniref:hypothetical protein n=1 Tax=unclassified Nostoc TaxID=2593658 RepID=UPI0025F9C65F|nr:hypothetical protein [Nostoc sp. JL33]MBN3872399.1 hypothetical protein [Nostoc sp. JL33]
MNTTKEKVQSLLNQLPDDCSIEDIQYHLYVIEKVSRGLEVADTEGAIAQEEVEERLSKWLIK